MNFLKEHWLNILLILLVTGIAWYRFYDHTLYQGGLTYYDYFNTPLRYGDLGLNYEPGHSLFWGHRDNLARIVYFIFIKLFQDNVQLINAVFYVFVIILHVSYYSVANIITKNKTVSFMAAILFSTNIVGNFHLYNVPGWFWERVINAPFILFSIAYYWRFLQTGARHTYLVSFALFTLGLAASHFTVIYIPIYLLMSFFTAIYTKHVATEMKKVIIVLLLFLLVTFLIARNSQFISELEYLNPNRSWQDLVFPINKFVKEILWQVVAITAPRDLIYLFTNIVTKAPAYVVSTWFILPILCFYFFVVKYLSTNKVLKPFILSSVSVAFLYPAITLYLNRISVTQELESSRYFFIPGMFFLLLFSLFLNQFLQASRSKKIIVAVLLILLTTSNIRWIWEMEKGTRYDYLSARKTIEYFKKTDFNKYPGYIIGVPEPVGRGGLNFLNYYYVKDRADLIYSDKIVQNFQKYKGYKLLVLGFNQWVDSLNEGTFNIEDKTESLYQKQQLLQDGGSADEIVDLIYGRSKNNEH